MRLLLLPCKATVSSLVQLAALQHASADGPITCHVLGAQVDQLHLPSPQPRLARAAVAEADDCYG